MTSRWKLLASIAFALITGACGDVEQLSPVPRDAGSCPADCDDGNPCTLDRCDDPATGCEHAPTSAPCDDGDACTVGDVCSGGACIGSGALDCDDSNACTDDTCNSAEGCGHMENALACDDGDACTVDDVCAGGACIGSGALDCDDSNACTDDTCGSAEGCAHVANTVACDDGDACTVDDVCAAGECTGGGALDCDDANACTDDACESAEGCAHVANALACDDGDACTVDDACAEGTCVAGGALDCDDGIGCTVDSCDAQVGCAHAPHDDVCDDVDGCTDDVCDTMSGCLHVANTAACDDGDPCTTGDICQVGQCTSGPIHVVETALGYGHGCAVKSDGSLWCWGLNSSGQLGDGTASDRRVPVLIEPSGVVSVGAGFAHTCILRTDGSVWCWGYGAFGTVGYTSPTPVLFNGVQRTDIAQLAVGGGGHTCALTTGGELWCWGYNGGGQVGDGTQIDAETPFHVQGLPPVALARAGEGRTCAVDMQGGLWCWGYGPLGDGTTLDSSVPVLIDVSGAVVSTVAVGGVHTCSMTTTSELYCWGDNFFGSVGTGTSGDAVLTPQLVSAPGSGGAFASAALGTCNTCALSIDGTAWCWGSTTCFHDWGLQLLPLDGNAPIQVQLPFVAAGLWAGGDHACAAAADGSLSCWGWNQNGDLGIGEAGYEVAPTLVSTLVEPVTAVDAGSCQTCAIGASGALYCWGTESSWDCGSAPYLPFSAQRTPAQVPIASAPGATPVKITVGGAHACTVMSDGTLWCWGENWYGQLAQPPSYRSDPVQVLSNVSDVCAGGAHTCARLNDATVWCWGEMTGAGTNIDVYDPVLKKSGIASLTCGSSFTCVLEFSGKLWCWGLNSDGQLGTGDFASTLSPTWVSALGSSVLEATAGHVSTCARTTQGLACWGDGMWGQLGTGASGDSPTPLQMSLGSTDEASVGGYHACALTGGAPLETWCWGKNRNGQLGTGTTEDSSVPIASLGPSMVKIAAAAEHTCAIATDGLLWCWGDNFFGQVGTGTLPYAASPTLAALSCP